MFVRSLGIGFVFWFIGTIAIRLFGYAILTLGRPLLMVILYVVSFALMGMLIPRVARTDREILLVILPTLILDALACIFFSATYPNLAASTAGLFGGWMLICCGGAVTGAVLRK